MASNNPLEDRRTEATCLYSNGTSVHNRLQAFQIISILSVLLLYSGKLFGVFDGHAGFSCAQVICKRLMRYIAASLLPSNLLKEKIAEGAKSNSFLECHNDKVDFIPEVNEIYEKSFAQYTRSLTFEGNEDAQINYALQNAFLHLDNDISSEALHYIGPRTLSVAMSGSVACVAYIDNVNLYVANAGDCCAILGSINDSGDWETKRLTTEHSSENVNEVRRITSGHPLSERDTVIRQERLLGQLAPLRAFGDFRYKWPLKTLKEVVVPHYGEHAIPPHYHTPPYLTAEPEITCHTLTPRDRFLVLATDGLWDFMSPAQVGHLVGEHMQGKVFLQPIVLPKRDITLGEISELLGTRR